MIHAVGLDVVEVGRMERDVKEYGDRFLARILSEAERETYDSRPDKAQFLAGRFACKEAVVKALGFRLMRRPAMTDLEVLNDSSGMPFLQLPDEIKEELGKARCLISISHEKKYAAAVAIITEDK